MLKSHVTSIAPGNAPYHKNSLEEGRTVDLPFFFLQLSNKYQRFKVSPKI
jgi:hypothetical protein